MRPRVRREAERIQEELRQGTYNDSPDYRAWIAVDGNEHREVGSVKPARIGPNDCGRISYFGYMPKPGQESLEWKTFEVPVWTRPWLKRPEQSEVVPSRD